MTTTKEFQLVDINKLVPYANNARTHNKEQILKLRSSLREFGFVNPVIIDKAYNVLAGHGRIEAAKEEGIAEVPCVYADHLTEAQKKAYILADNRMALDAGWDEELLSVEMQELQELGFDLSMTGFDEKELTDLLGANADGEAKEDDFDLSAALEKAAGRAYRRTGSPRTGGDPTGDPGVPQSDRSDYLAGFSQHGRCGTACEKNSGDECGKGVLLRYGGKCFPPFAGIAGDRSGSAADHPRL